jgi:outer membrane protein OmpA-like peptidoglycan-associated protein
VALGLKRATSVQRLLVDVGLDPSIIEVRSHGEVDQAVKTPDNTAEPRNRRVEIVVR